MNEFLTVLVFESAILNNYKIKGFEHMDIDRIKLFLFPETGKLTPVAVLLTRFNQIVHISSFGNNWDISGGSTDLKELKELFFRELYSYMSIFTHSNENFSMKLIHIAREMADSHIMQFTCTSRDFQNFVLTVTVEHPDKESDVIGREIFTCDKMTFDSLLEKVTETGNRIWNKYVEWQPYAYVTERGGNSYD